MKYYSLLFTLLFISLSFGQNDQKISTVETVEVLNNNKAEAIYYFKNNWKVLRDNAIKKGYIHSYSLMETTYGEETPFHIILITTYSNKEQYEKREIHFKELIDSHGSLRLLNDKKPGEFRKSRFSADPAKHIK